MHRRPGSTAWVPVGVRRRGPWRAGELELLGFTSDEKRSGVRLSRGPRTAEGAAHLISQGCSRRLLLTGKRAFRGEPGRLGVGQMPAASPVCTARPTQPGRMTWFLQSLPSGLVCPTSLTGQRPELYPRRGRWPSQGTRRVWAEASAWGWPLSGDTQGEMRTGEMPRSPVMRPH